MVYSSFFLSLLSSTLVGGLLRFLVLVPVSLFGLLVGWILLIGPTVLYLGQYRMLGMFIGRTLLWFLLKKLML